MTRFLLRSLSWLRLVWRLPRLGQFVKLFWLLLRDGRVPWYLKGMLAVTLVYVVSPIDLIPEAVALMFGLVDDVAILMAGVNGFLRLAPRHVIDDHLKTLSPDFQHAFRTWRGDQRPADRTDGAG